MERYLKVHFGANKRSLNIIIVIVFSTTLTSFLAKVVFFDVSSPLKKGVCDELSGPPELSGHIYPTKSGN